MEQVCTTSLQFGFFRSFHCKARSFPCAIARAGPMTRAGESGSLSVQQVLEICIETECSGLNCAESDQLLPSLLELLFKFVAIAHLSEVISVTYRFPRARICSCHWTCLDRIHALGCCCNVSMWCLAPTNDKSGWAGSQRRAQIISLAMRGASWSKFAQLHCSLG